ncbi:unnamed protein product [Cochlearia groenlandica]
MERASSSDDNSLSLNSDQTRPSSSMLSRTTSSSSSSASSSTSAAAGDYIGTESCFDVLSQEETVDAVSKSKSSLMSRFRYGGRRREEREARAAAAREFPPPIPSLAQTGNLLPHMPWVLKRVVTSDGRLILREEKVRHHEYFRAHRSNGRLTLHLVPLDDDVFELPQEPSHDHYQSDNDDVDECDDVDDECDDVDEVDDLADNVDKSVVVTSPSDHDGKSNNVDGDDGYRNVILAAVAEETVVESGGGSPRGKCLKSCFVDMSVRQIRPLLS